MAVGRAGKARVSESTRKGQGGVGSEGEQGRGRSGVSTSPSCEERVGACGKEVRARSGMDAMSQTRVAHWDILPSTWRAATWVRWAPFLGQIRADLDIGPKSKVVAHLRIYKTH